MIMNDITHMCPEQQTITTTPCLPCTSNTRVFNTHHQQAPLKATLVVVKWELSSLSNSTGVKMKAHTSHDGSHPKAARAALHTATERL